MESIWALLPANFSKDSWNLNGVERFGIPSIAIHDGPSGLNWREAGPTTALPVESVLSASWDTELLEKLGKLVAEECHAFKVGVVLGPGLNAKRSPLGGRNFEYYSEDPYLSGKLGRLLSKACSRKGSGRASNTSSRMIRKPEDSA